MKNFIINNLISLAITIYFKPYLDVVKNYEIERGYNLKQINTIYYIYLAACTISLGIIVYIVRYIFNFLVKKNNNYSNF